MRENIVLAVITIVVGRWLGAPWAFLVGAAMGAVTPWAWWRVLIIALGPVLVLFGDRSAPWAYAALAVLWVFSWTGFRPGRPSTPWFHIGHREAEIYRPGVTVYRYVGADGVQWRAVLFIVSKVYAFKARVGLIQWDRDLRWERYLDRCIYETPEVCWFDYENRFVNVGDLGWMWPSRYAIDGGVFLERLRAW